MDRVSSPPDMRKASSEMCEKEACDCCDEAHHIVELQIKMEPSRCACCCCYSL